jgi:multicomponent Na+:H+ antiporter subunit E
MSQAGLAAGFALRAVLYFGVWIVIDQSSNPSNLAVGVIASFAAAWASMKLLPPSRGRRAFAPRLDLHPGFVSHQTRFPPGSARSAFELIASLMPGSVPSDEGAKSIEFHCLDTRQPVADQLAVEEAVYARALSGGPGHG